MATAMACITCGASLEKKKRGKDYHETNGVHYCKTCYMLRYRDHDLDSDSRGDEPISQDEVKVDLSSLRVTYSYNHECILKNCLRNSALTRIPILARQQMLQEYKKYIPNNEHVKLFPSLFQ